MSDIMIDKDNITSYNPGSGEIITLNCKKTQEIIEDIQKNLNEARISQDFSIAYFLFGFLYSLIFILILGVFALNGRCTQEIIYLEMKKIQSV